MAYAYVELGNVALEDVLLAEFANECSPLSAVCDHLVSSDASLRQALTDCQELRDLMGALCYRDLPTLQELDLVELGHQFASRGMLRQQSWGHVCQIMTDGGFYKMLDYFEEMIRSLRLKTEALRQQVNLLEQPAQLGEVNLVLEENREGNIRLAFAELYTLWGSFSQDFLASSLLSTELWYAHDSRPSMVMTTSVRVNA
ncbi:MAG: hypothetical protein Q8O32_01990 [bacterium]|nr:hypothetical protein [bacterium]